MFAEILSVLQFHTELCSNKFSYSKGPISTLLHWAVPVPNVKHSADRQQASPLLALSGKVWLCKMLPSTVQVQDKTGTRDRDAQCQ